MPAHSPYLTSLLACFSTFLEGQRVDAQLAEEAALTLLKVMEVSPNLPSGPVPHQGQGLPSLNQDLTQSLRSDYGFSPAAIQLVTAFLAAFNPTQANVYLHQFLLALQAQHCSHSTLKNYRSDIGQFTHFLQNSDVRNMYEKPKVLAFLKHESSKGLQAASIRRKLVSLTQFAYWLEAEGLLEGATAWLEPLKLRFEQEIQAKSPQTAQNGLQGGQDGSGELAGRLAPQPGPRAPGLPLPSQSHPPSLAPAGNRSAKPLTARRRQDYRARWQQSWASLQSQLNRQPTAGKSRLLLPYVNLLVMVLFVLGVGFFGYRQFITEAPLNFAYPSTPERPNRALSFQGRLTDTAQNPITSATTMRFKLYDANTAGSVLWDSGTCSVTPDQDGIFSVGLGDECGSEIGSGVFSENSNVWLEATIGSETLTPRQPIKAVAYALNAETLQGYPIDATGAATRSTVVTMNQGGEIVLGEVSPKIKSVSGTFALEAQAMILQTAAGSNGNITLDPDGTGYVSLLADTAINGYLSAPGATLSATYAGGTALTLKAGPSATADIMKWQNSSGSTLGVIDENGNVGIGVANPNSFKLEVAGHVGPAADATYDLGTDSVRWRSGYFDTLYGDGSNLTGISASAITFTNITSGTNSSAAMVVGSGASLNYTGTGTINASTLGTKAESAFLTLSENETVTGTPAFNGGLTATKTISADAGTTTSVAALTLTTPADSTGTNVHQGLSLAPTIGNATGGTNTANVLNIAALAGDAEVSLNAFKIGSLTGTGAAEYALNVGSGWDSVLRVNGTEVINGSGQVVATQISGALFSTSSDSGSSTVDRGDTLSLVGGEGIDTSLSGDTYTIAGEDATTTNKGVAAFNDSYFGVSSGTVSIDDIYLLNTGDAGSGAYTFSGGAFSINASSNFATTINTGSSTGAVTIGGGSNTVEVASSSWDISTAGVATGFSALTATTGNFTTANVTTLDLGTNTISDGSFTGNWAYNSGNLSGIGTISSGAITATGASSFATSVTTPIVYGGTGASSTLSLAGTSNGSPSNAHVILNGSNQGNVGIGTTGPSTKLDVYGAISLADGGSKTYNGGLATQVNASLINFGMNEGSLNLFGGSYTQADQGGMLRVDTRSGQNLYQFFGRSAGTASSVGTQIVSITSAGNVGIGDTSPANLLTVGNGDLFQVNSSGAIAAAAGITSSGTINFSGLTASRMVFTDASSNLTNSAASSVLASSITDETGTGVVVLNTAPTFATSITSPIVYGGSDASSTLSLAGTSNGTPSSAHVLLNSGSQGNVGIGTSTPFETLQIGGGAVITGGVSIGTGANRPIGAQIRYGVVADTAEFIAFDWVNNTTKDLRVRGSTIDLRIGSAGNTSALFVNSTGNVGIGTSSPGSFRLNVNGATNISGDLTLTGTTITASSLTTLTTSASLSLASTTTLSLAGTGDATLNIGGSSGVGGTINGSSANNGNLTLQGTTSSTRGTSYVLLQPSGGNVGIGTSSPGTKLDVYGGVISLTDGSSKTYNAGLATEVTSSLINFGINEGSNSRFGGSYTQAAQGGMIRIDARAGQNLYQFYGRSAGTASTGGTQILSITSAGNVGIGQTSPGAFKLNVNGDTNIAGDLTLTGTTITASSLTTLTSAASLAMSSTTTLSLGGGSNAAISLGGSTGGTINGSSAANGALTLQGTTSSTRTLSYLLLQPNGGNVGIGTNAATQPLHVVAGGSSSVISLFERSAAGAVIGIMDNSGSLASLLDATGGILGLRSGHSGGNDLTISTSGNVGIGTTDPGAFQLNVEDSQSTSYVANIKNTSTTNTADGLLIDLGVANASRGAGNYFVGFAGAGTVAGKIQGAASAVVYTTTGADYAEYFRVDNRNDFPQAGDIVSVESSASNSINKSTLASMNKIVGVVSSNPGFIGNGPLCLIADEDCDTNHQKYNAIVALSGQVPVKVTTENGPITAGDPISISSTSGIGSKAVTAGITIGRALESYDRSETGTIKVYINVSWYDPDASLSSTGQMVITGSNGTYTVTPQSSSSPIARVGAFSEAVVGTFSAGLTNTRELVVTKTASIADLSVNSLSVNGQSLQDYIASVVTSMNLSNGRQNSDELISPLAQIDSLNAQTVTISDTVTANDIKATDVSVSGTTTLSTLLASDATFSGTVSIGDPNQASSPEVPALTVHGDASISGELRTESLDATSARIDRLEAELAQVNAIKAQTAELMDATISGTLYATTIAGFDEKVANAMKQPSLLATILQNQEAQQATRNPALAQDVVSQVETAGYDATGSAELDLSLEDLALEEADIALMPSAVFIEKYFKVNGSGYVADSLGIGNSLLIGPDMLIKSGMISYTSSDPTKPTIFEIQPEGKGLLSLMAGLLILDETGQVEINGNVRVAGDVQVDGTLLANLIQPADLGNPFQVQVAGVSTESGEVKRSRFEIIDEMGTPVATISAEGKANFAGGIGVGSEDLTASHGTNLTSSQGSGQAIIPAGASQITIKTPKVGPNSLIYVTPVGSTGNQVVYVKSKVAEDLETPQGEGQFIVGFDRMTLQNVQLNWWIIN